MLCVYDIYCLLTIFSFKVSKAELRSLVGDYDLSIQGEYHGFVLHVDHAAHHISFIPRPPKEMTAHMNPAALGAIFRLEQKQLNHVSSLINLNNISKHY